MKFHLRVGWWLGYILLYTQYINQVEFVEVDGFDDKVTEGNKFCYADIYFVVAAH